MDDLLTWLRAEIRKDIAGAEKLLEEGPERRWYDRYHCVYPRDLIARGLAELEIIAECQQVPGRETLAERVIERLALGYQNRSGFKPSWLD